MDSNNHTTIKDSNFKKIMGLVVLILTLSICTTVATYAYFALNPVTNNTVTGTAATASLTLTVTKSSPSSTGPLVPLKEAALANAIAGTTSKGAKSACLDNNNNVSCQVYTITIENKSSASVVVNGTITFAGSTNMPNLKWRKISSTTTLGSVGSTAAANVTTAQPLASNVSLAPTNGKQTYYIVVWINAALNSGGTEIAQTDTGTYRATIQFSSSNGTGVTSTITA